jgi:tryptophanyl-tRNA synthetase
MSVTTKKRVMSGMRTTNRLHIGNYFGALKNWVELQKDYQCFFGAMNWHALTDAFREPEVFKKYTRDIIIDWIAFGVDPEKSVIFIQSEVPETLELFMLFNMITPLPWLDRVTTWKDVIEDLRKKDIYNLGRYSYPVLQAADIAIFRGDLVPVGPDQVPHLELGREIIRRFNHLYKTSLPEPAALLTTNKAKADAQKDPTKTGSTNELVILGTDGRKMSKSYNNFVPLLEEPAVIEKICMKMQTDPARVTKSDPGNPDICPEFSFHKLFSSQETQDEVKKNCRGALWGCGDCKKLLAKNINSFMAGPLEKRKELLNKPSQLDEIIQDGCAKARKEGAQTLNEIREKLDWKAT